MRHVTDTPLVPNVHAMPVAHAHFRNPRRRQLPNA